MQKQIHGGDIYSSHYQMDFSTSISPLGVPDTVRKAYLEAVLTLHQYPDVECRELRQALSEHYSVPKDWLICSSGAAELIYAIAFAKRPRTALLLEPSFSEYETSVRLSGCQDVRFYTCREETGFLVGTDLLEMITDDLDIFFLCNPNNPTGVLVPQELMLEIVLRCKQKNVLLVLDECYVGLLRQPKQVTMLRQIGGNENLFLINAFTKMYAMPSLRLGFGISSDTVFLEKVRDLLQPWNVSGPAQACGIAALQDPGYVRRVRICVREEMTYLRETFDRIGITWYGSEGNFMFFKGPEDLFSRCGREGILIRDCSSYRGLGPGFFRVAAKTRRENEKLCGILENIYHENHRRGKPED